MHVLTSLALILLVGFACGGLFRRLRLPPFLGMLLTGIALGPYALDVIAPGLLAISSDLRQVALVIILIRAGLTIDIRDLRKVGRPAILLSVIPAVFEIAGCVVLGPILLGISPVESAVAGAMLAAVSPAVIVPKMIELTEKGIGTGKRIPQMIMASATADDIFALVLFAAFVDLYRTRTFDPATLLKIPGAVLTGVLAGICAGILLGFVFKRLRTRDTIRILLILGTAFLLSGVESAVTPYCPYSGLLAVLSLGCTLLKTSGDLAGILSVKFSKIWVGAELLLFVLLGAAVDVRQTFAAGGGAILLILGGLLCRFVGTWISVLFCGLNAREVLFLLIASIPKATVQAAIGAIPLSLGMPAGGVILSIAVMSVFLTSPPAAIALDLLDRRLLGPAAPDNTTAPPAAH